MALDATADERIVGGQRHRLTFGRRLLDLCSRHLRLVSHLDTIQDRCHVVAVRTPRALAMRGFLSCEAGERIRA